MATKTISLPEPVYERLREEKNEGESYGDVIERLMGGGDLEEHWGVWSEETAEQARDAVAEGRTRSDERLSDLLE